MILQKMVANNPRLGPRGCGSSGLDRASGRVLLSLRAGRRTCAMCSAILQGQTAAPSMEGAGSVG